MRSGTGSWETFQPSLRWTAAPPRSGGRHAEHHHTVASGRRPAVIEVPPHLAPGLRPTGHVRNRPDLPESSADGPRDRLAALRDRRFRWVLAALAVCAPAGNGLACAVLAELFDYPAVIDLPAAEVLDRSGRAGLAVRGLWLAATATALLLIPLAVGLGRVLHREAARNAGPAGPPRYLWVITTCGVLGGLCMALDLSQWVWLYPHLSHRWHDAAGDSAAWDRVVALQAGFHRYLGVDVGIYAATLFSGLWTLGAGRILLRGDRPRVWLGRIAIGAGTLFLASIAPGVGFHTYATLNEAGFLLWLLWLLGWAVLHHRPRSTRLRT